MPFNSSSFFKPFRRLSLAGAAAVALAVMPVMPVDATRFPNPITESLVCAKEMYTILPVDYTAARRAVPDRYPVYVDPQTGKAELVIANDTCAWTNQNDPALHAPDAINMLHFAITTARSTVPVPGSDAPPWPYTRGSEFYRLVAFMQARPDTLAFAEAAGWPIVEPVSMERSGSLGIGEVVEKGSGSSGIGFEWRELSTPFTYYLPHGFTNIYYQDKPNGDRRVDTVTHRKTMTAIGRVKYEADPQSFLGQFGTEFEAQSYYLHREDDFVSNFEHK